MAYTRGVMLRRAAFIGVLAAGGWLAASTAPAGELHLRYEAYWGGLHAADFTLSIGDDGATYDNRFRLRTRGIIDWLINLRIEASSHGRTTDAAAVWPLAYRVDYTNRRRQRTIDVRFDGEDGVAVAESRSVSGPEDDVPNPGEAVPADLRRRVIDPLTAFAAALRRARAHLDGGPASFRLGVYDGRRRFDVEGEYVTRRRRNILGQDYDVHQVRLTTVPRAGFKKSHRMLWDGTAFDLYLSADGRLVPLQIVSVGIGPVINLVGECPTACELSPE